jgi:flagellar hook-basal body complex protein FliE
MSSFSISSIDPLASGSKLGEINKSGQTLSTLDNFGQLLGDAINSLSQKENAANGAIASLAAGEDIELHQVMITMQQADIAFQLALQVRNKIVEAYQEVMRTQI